MSGITNDYGKYYNRESSFFTGRAKGIKDKEESSLMDAISQEKEEILDRLRRGETEPSIPMGASSFTQKQWNKLMRSVDRAIDDMQERLDAKKGERDKRAEEKKDSTITMEMLAELVGSDWPEVQEAQKGVLSYQIKGTERKEVDNALYSIKNDGKGGFVITHKETGCEYSFTETGCKLATDAASGKTFLLSQGDGMMPGRVMAADETLISMLSGYFGVEKLEAGELTGFTLERNAATGIEILIPPGMKGKTAHILIQSKADMDAYNKLVETYKRKYPNLVQSDEMAAFYASIEIEGLCHRTDSGILYTNAQGVSYADEKDPEKSWWIMFEGQSEENYDLVMQMMDDIAENREDIREYRQWAERLDRMGIAHRRAEFNEALEEFLIEHRG